MTTILCHESEPDFHHLLGRVIMHELDENSDGPLVVRRDKDGKVTVAPLPQDQYKFLVPKWPGERK